MHRFTLAFDNPEIERAYRLERRHTYRRRPLGITLAIAAVIWIAAALIFAAQLPGDRRLILVTVGAAAPLIAVAYALAMAVPRLLPYVVPWLVIILGGLLVVVLSRLGDRFAPYAAIALPLQLLGVHTFTNQRFVHATASTWTLVVAYLTVLLGLQLPATVVLHDAFWVVIVAQGMGMRVSYNTERWHRLAFLQARRIAEEHERSERLLRKMLPPPIVERLKSTPGAIADSFAEVTVLFADIVGFTALAERMVPEELVALLNGIFSTFDEMARRHGLEKIKTIGDAYMVVGGAPEPRHDHADAVAAMALEMRDAIARFGDGTLRMRIGMHGGPVVAGVIGTVKYAYDLWGDTVNTASRMESHGAAGEIQLTEPCRAVLGDRFLVEERGLVEIKGKGTLRTFWLRGHAVHRGDAGGARDDRTLR